jgi:hypothetical protein
VRAWHVCLARVCACPMADPPSPRPLSSALGPARSPMASSPGTRPPSGYFDAVAMSADTLGAGGPAVAGGGGAGAGAAGMLGTPSRPRPLHRRNLSLAASTAAADASPSRLPSAGARLAPGRLQRTFSGARMAVALALPDNEFTTDGEPPASAGAGGALDVSVSPARRTAVAAAAAARRRAPITFLMSAPADVDDSGPPASDSRSSSSGDDEDDDEEETRAATRAVVPVAGAYNARLAPTEPAAAAAVASMAAAVPSTYDFAPLLELATPNICEVPAPVPVPAEAAAPGTETEPQGAAVEGWVSVDLADLGVAAAPSEAASTTAPVDGPSLKEMDCAPVRLWERVHACVCVCVGVGVHINIGISTQ